MCNKSLNHQPRRYFWNPPIRPQDPVIQMESFFSSKYFTFRPIIMNCELSSLVSTIWDLIGSLNKPKNCPKPLKNTTLGTSKHPTQAKSIFNYFIYF